MHVMLIYYLDSVMMKRIHSRASNIYNIILLEETLYAVGAFIRPQ